MNLYQLRFSAAAACCMLAGGVGVALGGIDTPPPWDGTGLVGNSTHWHWDFAQGGTAPPNFPSSGFGPPNSQPPIVTGGTFHPPGSWGLNPGESITIDLPNFPDPNQFKLIWIQYHIFSLPGVPVQPPIMQVEFNGTTATPYGNPTFTPLPDGGLIGAQGFRFPFNPPFEVIHIFNQTSAPMFFEWLTIDTICAPTPGAGAALLLGSAACLRRRRR